MDGWKAVLYIFPEVHILLGEIKVNGEICTLSGRRIAYGSTGLHGPVQPSAALLSISSRVFCGRSEHMYSHATAAPRRGLLALNGFA